MRALHRIAQPVKCCRAEGQRFALAVIRALNTADAGFECGNAFFGDLFWKNMSVEIERMEYKEGTTVLNFPFISVFDKSELKEYSGIDTFGLDEGR